MSSKRLPLPLYIFFVLKRFAAYFYLKRRILLLAKIKIFSYTFSPFIKLFASMNYSLELENVCYVFIYFLSL